MNIPKVIINDNYADYLNGKEVEATMVERQAVEKGMHVMGFHNSIAINSSFPVPREKQAHYIGVEGMVTAIDDNPGDNRTQPHIRVRKV